GNAHVSIRRRVLNDLDCARILDPVAHFVLIQRSVGDSGREIIKARVKNGEIHDEIDGQTLPGTRRRKFQTFIYRVGATHILPEPVTEHETHVGLRHVVAKLHRNAHTDAIALRDTGYGMALGSKDANSCDLRLCSSVPMIDVRNMGQELWDSCSRFVGYIEIR